MHVTGLGSAACFLSSTSGMLRPSSCFPPGASLCWKYTHLYIQVSRTGHIGLVVHVVLQVLVSCGRRSAAVQHEQVYRTALNAHAQFLWEVCCAVLCSSAQAG